MNSIKFILLIFLFSCGNKKDVSSNNTLESIDNKSLTLITVDDFDKHRIESIYDNNDSYKISFGSSSGMCVKNCKITNIITSKGLINIIESNDSIKFPKKINIVNSDKYNYDSIIFLLDFDLFLKIKQNSVSDDKDQGVNWIEVSNSVESKRNYYHIGREPIEIKNLIDYLNKII